MFPPELISFKCRNDTVFDLFILYSHFPLILFSLLVSVSAFFFFIFLFFFHNLPSQGWWTLSFPSVEEPFHPETESFPWVWWHCSSLYDIHACCSLLSVGSLYGEIRKRTMFQTKFLSHYSVSDLFTYLSSLRRSRRSTLCCVLQTRGLAGDLTQVTQLVKWLE